MSAAQTNDNVESVWPQLVTVYWYDYNWWGWG